MGIPHNSRLWSLVQSSHFRQWICLEIEFGFNLWFKSHRQRCSWKSFRSHLLLCPCHVHGLVYRQKGLTCVGFFCVFQSLTFNMPGDSVVKNPPANSGAARDTRFDPWVGKEMTTYSSILAGIIPWTEEPCGLQSMKSHSEKGLSAAGWRMRSMWGGSPTISCARKAAIVMHKPLN